VTEKLSVITLRFVRRFSRHITGSAGLDLDGNAGLGSQHCENAPQRANHRNLPFIISCTVRANPVMLEQFILQHILENAIQYSPDSAPVLITGHKQAGRLKSPFRTRVQDSGFRTKQSFLTNLPHRQKISAKAVLVFRSLQFYPGIRRAKSPPAQQMGRGPKIIVKLPASPSPALANECENIAGQ
jgi:hypothetical protein